jgi:hypothetical protein
MVNVEGIDETVAGARVQILMGNDFGGDGQNERVVETGGDGRFVVDLRNGPVRIWLGDLPAGYLAASIRDGIDNLTAGRAPAAIEREYRVRKGTIWRFRFTRGVEQKLSSGCVACRATLNAPLMSRPTADVHDPALLTLPAKASKVGLNLTESAPESAGLRTSALIMSVEWEANFRPHELREITRLLGSEHRFRLVDSGGRSALIDVPESIEPVSEAGQLLIRVALPATVPGDLAALTGKVVDSLGQRIAVAEVALRTPGAFAASEPRRKAMTDDQGRYRLTDIPRLGIGGKPLPVNVWVTKEGYAGFESALLTLKASNPDAPQVVNTIRLERGVTITGILVDPRGQPLAIDRTRMPNHARGLTANAYGLRAPPLLIVIDRAGKIAFRTDSVAADPAQTGVFRQLGWELQTMTEEKVNERIEKVLREEIEKVLE